MLKQVVFRLVAILLVLAVFELLFRAFIRLPVPRLCRTGEQTDVWCQSMARLVDHDGWLGPPAGAVYQHIYPDNSRGYFRPGGVVDYHLNAQGFRGPNFTDAGAGTRLAFLGDSFTFGEGVHLEDTFVTRTEALLKKETGNELRAFNLAQPGINTLSEARILERFGPVVKPRWVLLVVTPNDWPSSLVAAAHGADVRGQFTSQFEETPLYRWSRMLWWFDARWRQLSTDREQANAYNDIREQLPAHSISLAEMTSSILRIRDIASGLKARLVVVVLPELVRLTAAEYPYPFIHESIVRLGKSEGFPVIDVLPDFMDKQPAELWVHAVDHHPNEKAHALIAERISKDLLPLMRTE